MDPTTYRFEIGGFECLAVSDGQFAYAPPLFPPPAHLLFTDAGAGHLGELLRGAGTDLAAWTEWTSQYTCLLIRTGEQVVLIDTGAGSLGPGTGQLLGNLATEGIRPEDVDTIILTHAHPDHLGGNTDAQGAPAFSRARWVMSRAEWEFWMEGTAERVLPPHSQVLVGMARRQLSPLLGTVDLAVGDEEIVPGVRVIPTPGHTPGHLSVGVSSGNEELLCLGDLFLHPINVQQPQWCSIFDALPDVLAQSRASLLAEASVDRSLLMAFHFPFPGLGRVAESGAGWRWEPAAG